MMRRRRVLAALLFGALLATASASAAVAADDPGGFDLSVEVLSSGTPSPSPSPSPSGDSSDPNGSGGGGYGSGSDEPDPVEEPAPEPAEPDETGIPGVLYVSGVGTASSWSWQTVGQALVANISVRNASSETFDTSVSFRLENPFGGLIASSEKIAIRDLRPGEQRTVRARLDGAGQWTYLHVVATVTPPAALAADAGPLMRETWVLVLPWAGGVLAVVALASLAIVRIVRGPRRLRMPGAQPTGAPA
ncbi:hypothetical protein [Homoserinibacter sp. GY 40078]|uniref:hypothetical protein n=1 Tax=Homoserinibacter sp. GY 40078 TaxID=2603275 RepID=UPI0011C770ED|nr:hypothetical protein [Homoserinibacter sp. GY 40078]TXK19484.1 hypothetical protein FVQ89_06230 [Homoserinibacter sp. GY 40078]